MGNHKVKYFGIIENKRIFLVKGWIPEGQKKDEEEFEDEWFINGKKVTYNFIPKRISDILFSKLRKHFYGEEY